MNTDRSDLLCDLKELSAHPGAGGGFVACAVDTALALPLVSIQTTLANESPDVLGGMTMSCTSSNQCNQQYSVTAVTTSAGAIAERYAYEAYGELTFLDSSGFPLTPQSSTLDNRYTYTGREWDSALKLYHFRARMMSPVAGRFLGRDPIGYEGSKWGLYAFLDSKVLIYRDPSGLGCRVDFKCSLVSQTLVEKNDYDCTYQCVAWKKTLAPLSGGGTEPISCDDIPGGYTIPYSVRVDNPDRDEWIRSFIGLFCEDRECEPTIEFWRNLIGKGDILIFPKCLQDECRQACDKGEDIVQWLCSRAKGPAITACYAAAKIANQGGCRVFCDSVCK